MALTVEDGTGIDGANGYITVDYYKDYLKDRGRTTSLGGSAIGSLIIQATDFVEAKWLMGRIDHNYDAPVSDTQGLTLPTNCFPMTDVLRNAIVQYAEHVANGGSFYATQQETGPVKMKSEKVGPIEETTEYDTTRATIGGTYQKIPAADVLMKRFLGISTNKQVVRN